MAKNKGSGLREQAQKWTCNQFSITDHGGDAAKLLRKAADAIEQLGEIALFDIVFRSPADPSFKEITVSVYFSFRSES
jgi:cysteine sulfinate desulfinase/cysteine desulfurase-like protein